MIESRSFWRIFLVLLSLNAIAFAQSMFQALAGNPEFLVLHRVSHADLFLFVAAFEVAPALLLGLVWLVVRKLAPEYADGFLAFTLWLLLVPFLFELHKRFAAPYLGFQHNTLLLAIPLALAAYVAFRYRSELERFLLLVSPVVVIFPALFLGTTWGEIAPEQSRTETSFISAALPEAPSRPPIYVLVLDEFTRFALLDDKGEIDAAKFPHFAELARHSTWFDNATANAEYTTRSIPVIVTGNFPHGNDASDAAYPSLFRLLSPVYDITIHEVFSRFCSSPRYHCPDAARVNKPGQLLRSALEVYLWRVAPNSVVVRIQAEGLRTEQQRFEGFLREIGEAPGNGPQLDFMHLELPHAPYLLNPDGTMRSNVPNSFEARLAGDSVALAALRSDYEQQVQYVDGRVGAFIDRLKQTGLYDRALIIITSDHGVSWLTNAPGRTLTQANAAMILPIPLFIKLPDQSTGSTSNQDVQLIDVTPTIAAVAGIQIPWRIAGRNIFGADQSPREKIAYDANGKKFVLGSEASIASR